MIQDFIKKNLRGQAPLLLALSGGADSKALLLMLLECKKKINFELHIAHVDHGWREESRKEAKVLEMLADIHHLPFHLKTLVMPKTANLEEVAREARLKFFEELQKQFHYQALLLAHHKDDLVETILKRLFEGSGYGHVLAMESISYFNTLTLWRPLLKCSKQEIYEYLLRNNSSYLDDYTNRDQKFLRARMRKSILPFLNENFGKEVSAPLIRHAMVLKEMDAYLDQKTLPIWSQRVNGPFGDYFYLKDVLSLEARFIIKKLAQFHKIILSASHLDRIMNALIQNKSNHKIEGNGHYFIIDRGYLFLVLHEPLIKNWKIVRDNSLTTLHCSWKEVWQGRAGPINNDSIVQNPKACMLMMHQRRLDKWWNDHKVPAFMREFVPVEVKEDRVVREFLSGYTVKKQVEVEFQSSYLIYIQ